MMAVKPLLRVETIDQVCSFIHPPTRTSYFSDKLRWKRSKPDLRLALVRLIISLAYYVSLDTGLSQRIGFSVKTTDQLVSPINAFGDEVNIYTPGR